MPIVNKTYKKRKNKIKKSKKSIKTKRNNKLRNNKLRRNKKGSGVGASIIQRNSEDNDSENTNLKLDDCIPDDECKICRENKPMLYNIFHPEDGSPQCNNKICADCAKGLRGNTKLCPFDRRPILKIGCPGGETIYPKNRPIQEIQETQEMRAIKYMLLSYLSRSVGPYIWIFSKYIDEMNNGMPSMGFEIKLNPSLSYEEQTQLIRRIPSDETIRAELMQQYPNITNLTSGYFFERDNVRIVYWIYY